MHAFNSPNLFSRKRGYYVCEFIMAYSKRTPEENLKVHYINIFIYSQFLLLLIYISNHMTNTHTHTYIYINTFPLTFIEDSMVEEKSHTT